MDVSVQNIVCLDSLNCNQVNAFYHSLRKIPPSCVSFSSYRRLLGSLPLCHSVVNCTCSLLFFPIFHFLFTTFTQQPFSAKAILGFLHLICISNEYCRSHKRATFKRKQNKRRPKQDGEGILRFCPDLHIQQSWLPCLVGNIFRVVRLCDRHIF